MFGEQLVEARVLEVMHEGLLGVPSVARVRLGVRDRRGEEAREREHDCREDVSVPGHR